MFFNVEYDYFIKFVNDNKLIGNEYDYSLGTFRNWYDKEGQLMAIASHGIAYNEYMAKGECNNETLSFVNNMLNK